MSFFSKSHMFISMYVLVVMQIHIGSTASSAETWGWTANIDESFVYIVYGVPDSDTHDLEITCNIRGGDTMIAPNIASLKMMDGLRLPIRLSSQGEDLELTAQVEWNEVLFRNELTAKATASQVVRLLSKPGTLKVSVAGKDVAIPLGADTARALATFQGACPSVGQE